MVGGGGLLDLWGCLGVGGWAVWFVELEAPQQWQVGVVLLIYVFISFFFLCVYVFLYVFSSFYLST